jgi:DNA-binding NarL/FixJ family response regulator
MGARVLIVDEHPIFRLGMRALLADEAWVSRVDEAASIAEAIRTVTECPIDVVGLDVRPPDGDGTAHIGRLLRIRRGIRILVVTADEDDETVRAAIAEGAHGYLLKGHDGDDIAAAFHTVAGGGFVLGPGIPHVLHARPSSSVLPPPFDKITARERDLLGYLTAGHANADIAERLGLAEKTVRNQLTSLFDKIGASNRTSAAVLARQNGLTPPSDRYR